MIEFKLEHERLTCTRGGFCGWIQLKVWQYNVTSALYMLDWWERLVFNIFMGSVFTGIVLSVGRETLVQPVQEALTLQVPSLNVEFAFERHYSLCRKP